MIVIAVLSCHNEETVPVGYTLSIKVSIAHHCPYINRR
jgi:hypothetical protein